MTIIKNSKKKKSENTKKTKALNYGIKYSEKGKKY